MQNNHLGFSWKQFWITFIYENLPPVLISAIAALLIERSWHRTQTYTTIKSIKASDNIEIDIKDVINPFNTHPGAKC